MATETEMLRQALNALDTHPVLALDCHALSYVVLDLSGRNERLNAIDIGDPAAFNAVIAQEVAASNAAFAVGAYDEDRVIYDHSALFKGGTPRTIHLGIDLWVQAGTTVFAPVDGVIHSFANNAGDGDYGPTIILEHECDGRRFFTLYGHLSIESLDGLRIRRHVMKGTRLGRVGTYPQNGNWPPHLHFQIITDMQGKRGDFFGVAPRDRRKEFLALCPDPNIILRIPGLYPHECSERTR